MGNFQPIKLYKLRSLKVDILQHQPRSTTNHDGVTMAILVCYTSIGSSSRVLKTLHLCAVTPSYQEIIHGDKLIFKIVNNHAASICSLRLDDMSTHKETLLYLFARCVRLEELGLKLMGESMNVVYLIHPLPIGR